MTQSLQCTVPSSELPTCPCPLCQGGADHPDRQRHQQLLLVFSRLDESQRRWFVALEARRLGLGGDRLFVEITGMDEKTSRRGRDEPDASLVDKIRPTAFGGPAAVGRRLNKSGHGSARREEGPVGPGDVVGPGRPCGAQKGTRPSASASHSAAATATRAASTHFLPGACVGMPVGVLVAVGVAVAAGATVAAGVLVNVGVAAMSHAPVRGRRDSNQGLHHPSLEGRLVWRPQLSLGLGERREYSQK